MSSIQYIFIISLLVLCTSCTSRYKPKQNIIDTDPALLRTQEPMAKTVVVYARGLDDTDATLELINAFNASSADIHVKYQELPYDEEQRYIQIQKIFHSENSDIDIIDINMAWNSHMAQLGYILPLDDYIQRDKINMGDYVEAIVEGSRYKDSIYAMPRSISTGLFYYRNDLINTPPTTWEELLELASLQRGIGDTRYSYVFHGKVSETLVCEALEFIYSYGGNVLDEMGELDLLSNETINGLNMFYSIYNSSFVPDNIYKMTDNDACISFENGDSLFMRNLPTAWFICNKDDSKIAGNLSLATLPSGDKGSVSVLNGYTSIINSDSKNPELAWEFVKFIASPEGQKILAIHGGRIPAAKAVLADEEVISINPHFSTPAFITSLSNAVPFLITPYYTKLSEILQDELYLFLTGKKTAETTINSIYVKFYNDMEILNDGDTSFLY